MLQKNKLGQQKSDWCLAKPVFWQTGFIMPLFKGFIQNNYLQIFTAELYKHETKNFITHILWAKPSFSEQSQSFPVNTFRAAWFRRFLQKRQQFSVALPTP